MRLEEVDDSILTENNFSPRDIFYVNPSDYEGIMVRPKGDSVLLNKNSKPFEEILGIAPSFTSPSDALNQLISTVSDSEDLVNCYIDPNLKINKKICLWCMRRTECDLSEQTFQSKSMKYAVYTKKRIIQPLKSDVELVKHYLASRQYKVRQSKVFSDTLDPFKPGLTTLGSRTISIFRLADLNYGLSSKSCNWGHIFFSKILNRSITVTEAILINNYIRVVSDKDSLNPYLTDDSTYSLPSVKDLIDFFYNLSGDYELNMTKKNLRMMLDDYDLIGGGVNKLSNDFSLIKSLYSTTKKYFNTGFFDEELELFSFYVNGMTLDDCIVELFHRVQTELQNNFRETSRSREVKFFESRKKCYILSGGKSVSVPLPVNYQIVRIDFIEGLSEPWILVDGVDQQICFKGRKSGIYIPGHWGDVKISSIDMQLYFISKNGQRSEFVSWQGQNQSIDRKYSNRPVLFLPVDIHSFMSMNLVGKSTNFSTSDMRTEIKRHNFWKLINSLFFDNLSNQGLVEKRIFRKNHRKDLAKFRQEFNRPIYKRYSPIMLVEKLSASYSFIRQYIQYTKRPTEENSQRIIHEIKLISPGFSIGEDDYNDLVWIFQREEEERTVDEDFDIESNHSHNELLQSLGFVTQQIGDRVHSLTPWRCVKNDGWEFKYNHDGKLTRFCELLNFDGEFKSESFFAENPCVWMSPKLLHQFKSESEKLTEIRRYIGNRINQEGKFSGLIFTFSSELPEIEVLVGKLIHKETSIAVGDDMLMMCLPKIAISETSQNFLPLKII